MTEAYAGAGGGAPRSSLDRILEAVRSTGLSHKVSRGTHIQSECPTHSDSNPSLSIDWVSAESRVMLHCQANCAPEDVLAALGLSWPELHDDYEDPETFRRRREQERTEERRRGVAPKPRQQKASKPARRPRPALPKGKLPNRLTRVKATPAGPWETTATYDYCNLEGEVIHQEVREQRPVRPAGAAEGETVTEKRFHQRWPNGAGGWVDLTPTGFEPVLYRLPDVAGWIADDQEVWLCEGVKDADRLLALDLAATTNPSGAGNFKASQAEALRGAQVAVVLDHDLAGYSRGIKLHTMLATRGTATAVRLLLPATTELHSDASDHLDAGHDVEDFVEVTIEDLTRRLQVAQAEDAAAQARDALNEATQRAALAAEADDKSPARQTETRYAGRWAAEVGKHLTRAVGVVEEAVAAGGLEERDRDRFGAAVTLCQEATVAAHREAGVSVPAELQAFLEPGQVPPVNTVPGETSSTSAEADREQSEGRVVDHPTVGNLPGPGHLIEMSRGTWAFELGGEGRRPRGVYMIDSTDRWVWKAPLPYLHARIVSRDGYGRPLGHYYLVSAQPDSVRISIGQDELAKHTWANILGLAISQDDKILKAASTALIFAAEQETEIVEATPRVDDDGSIALPMPETLPEGYLATSPLERETALEVWGELVEEAAENTKMALVLGAAAFGPFLPALETRQSHILSLHGEMAQGKSTTMHAAASIWGFPGNKAKSGVCTSWNQSKLAPTSFLGELGILPAFFDEIGQAGNLTSEEWGKRIFDICEGASRGRPAANGKPGFMRGRSWYGILFSAGNRRLMEGIGAGGMAGAARRVVELATPFTTDRDHSDRIDALYPQAYGHLGAEILERFTAETVQPYLEEAALLLVPENYDSSIAQQMISHLLSHVAGAAMIDDIVGADRTLTAAAAMGALEYLAEWEEPEHDADRILEAIHDSLFQEPACWPTVAQHLENTAPVIYDGQNNSQIARHGVALKTKGLIANDTSYLGVFPGVWEELCTQLKVDSDVACRELARRGVLIRQKSATRTGAKTWQSNMKAGKAKRVYKLVYPELEDGSDGDETEFTQPDPTPGPDAPLQGPVGPSGPREEAPVVDEHGEPALMDEATAGAAADGEEGEPVTGRVTPPTGEVTGGVTAPTPPLTSGVTGVTGVTAPSSHVGAPARGNTPPTYDAPSSEVDQAPSPSTEPEVATTRSQSEPDTRPQRRPGKTDQPRGARFTAPAVCLDAEAIHCADGSRNPWPQVAHLGDLALLTSRDQLRLGWGGGEDRLPDHGQVWLYPSALERLGLPASLPELPDKALTKAQRAKETAKIFEKLDDQPVVAEAIAAGWQLGQGGHLGVWTRIWHTELLPQGALIVGLPWHRIEGVGLFAGDPEPGELAARLLLFAQRVGVAYRITAAATGLDLIDHHRPTRRDADDERGEGRGRVALIRHEAAELPPWRMKTTDARFTSLEADFCWWRPWDTLAGEEQASTWVHGYDRNASYLVPWRSLELGVEDLVHHTGEQARWDGKEHPGYYLIDDRWDWPHAGLPDPGEAAGARVGKGRMWVTVHTLRQLATHGIHPQIHESYTWGVTARYLEGPGTALAGARTALTGSADARDVAVLSTVKDLYSSTVGKLAEREHHSDFHLWRPDWRDHVIAATRTAILHTLTKAHEISGAHPVAVDRDAVFYLSNDPDPLSAWPGDPKKLGTALGSWKPIGSADAATWGPAHLRTKPKRWRYSDAVAALDTEEVNSDAR